MKELQRKEAVVDIDRKKRLEKAIINDEMIIASAIERIKKARKKLSEIVSRETKYLINYCNCKKEQKR